MEMMMQTHNVHEAARIYYDNAPPFERENIEAMFRGMDADNDRVISLDEFLGQFRGEMREDDQDYVLQLFVLLDENKNNLLEFNAFKTLHYFFKSRPICHNCKRRLLYFYYCCVNCWETHIGNGNPQHGGGSEPFKLCLECYTKRSYKHQHSKFLDNYMLLQPMEKEPDKKSGKIPIKSKNSSMETEKSKDTSIDSVLESGHSYYKSLGHEEKHIANEIFSYMDRNKDGKISVLEVIDFLLSNELPALYARKVFEYMGLSDDHNLTIEDAVAVWYTVCMRPCCRQCNTIITGTYYSCVECYRKLTTEDDADTWDLCARCYNGRLLLHEHAFFLDNFVLLHMKNMLGVIPRNQSQMPGSSSNLNPPRDHIQAERAILMKKLKKILKGVLYVGAAAGANAGATALCNIM